MVRVRRRETEEEEDGGGDGEGEEGAVGAPTTFAAPFSPPSSVPLLSTLGGGGVRALRTPRLVGGVAAVAAAAPKAEDWSLGPLLMLLRRRRVVTMLALAVNLTEG